MVESAKVHVMESGNHNVNSYDYQEDNGLNVNPYTMLLHAMKSPVTKTKYSRHLEMFFDFLKIPSNTCYIYSSYDI